MRIQVRDGVLEEYVGKATGRVKGEDKLSKVQYIIGIQ